ncbi:MULTISPECIES: alpha/beta fold hydrolase [unclassified Nocardioides]|uniref:alpha/beta fold hydrolase n=1 Tax=unclassified Nocardioides TaxID=2615069 RepID=UPI0036168547
MRRDFVSSRGLAGWVTGSGPEVLLLHGGPGMTDYMESLLPELDGHRVASFQQRGVAPSTLAGPLDVPTLRDDVLDVLDTLGWRAPAIIGHSWGGHLVLHLLAEAPARVGAALLVDALGAYGDGGVGALEAEMFRRLPGPSAARLHELGALEEKRPLTHEEALESMELAWPAYFSSLDAAQPIPQTDHAQSAETWASIRTEMPALPGRLRGCAVPARLVHGARDPLPVSVSEELAELLGAAVDVLPDNGHFPWLEDPGCVRRSLDRLLRLQGVAQPG